MVDLFHVAEMLFDVLIDVGSFFLDTSLIELLDIISPALKALNIPTDLILPVLDFGGFGSFPVVYYVFGAGLIFMLSFKFIKFFTDIIF